MGQAPSYWSHEERTLGHNETAANWSSQMNLPIAVDNDAIAEFCVRHHILKLSFFGSVLREDFRPDSDVDVLVEFDRAHIPTYFDLFDMEEELTRLFGRKVDLRTPNEIGEFFRDRVLAGAATQYVA